MKRRPGWAAAAQAPAAGLFVVAIGLLLAFAASGGDEHTSFAANRAGQLPTRPPLAILPYREGVGTRVTRLDPLTLTPTGPSHVIGEYRNTYSFAPGGKRIAFGISANPDEPAIGCCGRVGIRLVRKRNLTVSANIRTGIFKDAVAWLRPRRLVAATGGSVTTVNPRTGEVLKRRNLFGYPQFACPAADAREQALILLAPEGERNLFVIGPGGGVRTFELPPEFARCGQIALAPSGDRAFVVAKDGSVVTEVALARSRRIVHRLPAGRGGVKAVGLTRRRLLLAHRRNGRPKGIELIKLRNGSRRTIDPKAGKARLVTGTVLTYDSRRLRSPSGVRGYRPNGRRRFQLLGGKRIAKVEGVGRFAYAMHTRGLAVIDVPSGTVVSRSSTRPPLGAEFLTRRPAHGFMPR